MVRPGAVATGRAARVVAGGGSVRQAGVARGAAVLPWRRLSWPLALGVVARPLASLREPAGLDAIGAAASRAGAPAGATIEGRPGPRAVAGGGAGSPAGVLPPPAGASGRAAVPSAGGGVASPRPPAQPSQHSSAISATRPQPPVTFANLAARWEAASAGMDPEPAPPAPGSTPAPEPLGWAPLAGGAPPTATRGPRAAATSGLRDVRAIGASGPAPRGMAPPVVDIGTASSPADRILLGRAATRRSVAPDPPSHVAGASELPDAAGPAFPPAGRPVVAGASSGVPPEPGSQEQVQWGPVVLDVVESALEELLRREVEQHGLGAGAW